MTSFPFPSSRILALTASILILPTAVPAQPAQPAPPPDAAQQATELYNQNKFAEAAALFEQFAKDNPSSPVIADVRYRLALSYLRAQQVDKAQAALKEFFALPADKIPPPIMEGASILMGEVLRAKAGAMKGDDPARTAAFEEAMKAFDTFIAKYPQSPDLELAMYQRAISAFYTKDYGVAVPKLTEYLQRFPNADQSQDIQFLLSIALASQAADILKAKPSDEKKKEALAMLTQAEAVLAGIIQKRADLALINDALFQLGETYYLHAQGSDPSEKPSLLQKAREAFGKVQPKEPLIKAQKDRIAWLQAQMPEVLKLPPGRERDQRIQRFSMLLEREKSKLADIEQKAPPTLAAQIRMGEILFQDKAYDEVRVLFNYLKNVVTNDDQKKSMAYHVAMTYPMQAIDGKGETGPNGITVRAVKVYEDFKAKYIDAKEKENPTMDNLPVMIGMMFMNDTHKDYDKAVQYLSEAMTLYPKGRYINQALLQISEAYRLKGEPDKAVAKIEEMLKSNPDPVLMRSANISLALLLKDQWIKDKDAAKLDQAIEKLRGVVKDFPDSDEAVTARGILVEMLQLKGDPVAAAKEAREYADKYPDGEQTPIILRMAAISLETSKDVEGALKVYREIIQKFPDHEEAGNAYFQIARIASKADKPEEVIAIFEEFIKNRPNDPKIADAYFHTAQAMEKMKPAEGADPFGPSEKAIARYLEFQQKYPDHPRASQALLRVIQVRERIATKLFSGLSDPAKKAQWEAQVKGIIEQSEALLEKYPDSDEVASVLSSLMAIQKKRIGAQLIKTDDLVAYFDGLRNRFGGNTQLRSRISFALAAYLYSVKPEDALPIMDSAYDPNLKYAPADLELYIKILTKNGKTEKVAAIYEKLAKDYEGDNSAAGKEAKLVVIVGEARAAFDRGDDAATDAAIVKFNELVGKGQRTSRHGDIDLIQLERAYKVGKLEDVVKLAGLINNDKFAPPEVKARALFLAAELYEKAGKIKEAADNYRKIPAFYGNVEDISSEALFRAGGLLEKIAAAETDPEIKKTIMGHVRKSYQLILENYGSSKWADKARERLSQIR